MKMIIHNRSLRTPSQTGSQAWALILAKANFPDMKRTSCLLITAGLLSCGSFHSTAATHFVNISNPAPAFPYITWETAATNIQDAVDAADAGELVLVTNGVYATGGKAIYETTTNRVAVTKALTLQSVNGPDVTTINGVGSIRCVYLTNEAVLSGFTLTRGAARLVGVATPNQVQSGGGVFCASAGEIVTNCVLTGNSAPYGGGASGGTLHNCLISSNAATKGGGAHDSILNSCTLTGNTASSDGGGALDSTLYSCVLSGNSAGSGGGSGGGTLNNCTLNDNSARSFGGGAASATLNNCTLSGNSAAQLGGGAYIGTLNNCVVTKNSGERGGGAYGGTLNKCTLSGNSASYCGGGSCEGTLNNCKLIDNSASTYGGGAYAGALVNCALSGNSVTGNHSSSPYSLGCGGGAYEGTLTNCTMISNTSSFAGGGSCASILNNCIVYYNRAPHGANWSSGTLNYCCTTPLPSNGSGNISAEPQLASTSHLSAGSPCRGAGSAADASGVDIDGEAWLSPPSIGCDEYHSGSVTGALSVAVVASYTNVAAGFEVEFQGLISGEASASRWEFDDGTIVSNQPYASRAWLEAGDYTVVLRAYNDSNPSGVTATAIVQVVEQPVHYVSLSSVSPVTPYSTWPTAATNIQDAVDSATVPGTLVLVSNGVYKTGGRVVDGAMTNRVAVTKPLQVQSVNGPDSTIIAGNRVPGTTNGDGAIRCVYLVDGAILSGFTLTTESRIL